MMRGLRPKGLDKQQRESMLLHAVYHPEDVDVGTRSRSSLINSMLETLTDREQKVLRMRFGIGMNTGHSLQEVGKQFGVTHERIRQIVAKALRKLRHPSRVRILQKWMEVPND